MRRPRLNLGLTARGSALMTAGITALFCGYVLGQRDLVRVAILLVGAPIIAAVFLSRSRISIASQRSAEPNRVPPGVPILLRISLTNQSILATGSLMLEDRLGPPFEQRARFTLDSLRGRETRTLAYHLPTANRGEYRVGPLVMRLADPFGLVERTRSFRAVSDILVLPAVDPLPPAPLPGAWDSSLQAGSHAIGSHGSDDASIREYRYGDDLRKVHWRSTARLGSMMMRQEERPWHGRTSVLLDTRAVAHRRRSFPAGTFDDDPRQSDSFEWALSAAASVATHLQGRGRNLDLVAGELVLRGLAPGLLLDRLARLSPASAVNLGLSLSAAEAGGDESNIFAILGAVDEASLRSLTRRHRSPGSALALLLDTPTWATQLDNARADGARPLADVDGAASGTTTPAPAPRPGGTPEVIRAELALTGAGWRVHRVQAGAPTADAWLALMNQSSPGAMRMISDHLVVPAGGRP